MDCNLSRGLALVAVTAFILTALLPAAGFAQSLSASARTDKNPKPGDNFTIIVSISATETANYTVIIAPRPEFAITDQSNGSKTQLVSNGTTVEFLFRAQVARSAYDGSYTVSYTVLRDNATVKMDVFTVKIGSGVSCLSVIFLLPPAGVGICAIAWRRETR